jgi:uncharacterized protein YdeI (YjbR/CyaY-like superfamily)
VTPTFFPTPAAFRRWLARHGATATELWIGFYKKGSGLKGMTYAEAVDEALCQGWIDGLLKRIDDTSFMQRFTPRKRTSFWSAVNIAKVQKLEEAGRMRPAGLAAFANHASRRAPYSHEQVHRDLEEANLAQLRRNRKAADFWEKQAPSYRKVVAWWIGNAKREDTRARRVALLIECSAEGRRVPQFISPTGRDPAAATKRRR